MTLRTRFLITALFVCHQLPGVALVTRQLPSDSGPQENSIPAQNPQQGSEISTTDVCSAQAAQQDADSATICADTQEKIGDIYKLRGNGEIHYRTYVLRADELTYNSDTGEVTASGQFTIDGGPTRRSY
jgi:lipopolysaccharide assembly outer membrane protein LptD (OstA)